MAATRRAFWRSSRAAVVPLTSIPLVILLGGCISAEQYGHYAIFDREPELADAPPPDLDDQELSTIDVDSFRFAIEYEGDRLYLAKESDRMNGICLLVDSPGDTGVTAACSGGTWVGLESAGGNAYHVHPDDIPAPPGYEDITENVAVRTGTE